MSGKFYTLRIRLANTDTVRLEIKDNKDSTISEKDGVCGLKDNETYTEVKECFREILGGDNFPKSKIEKLGRLLCDCLFDKSMKATFLEYYQKARDENAFIRLELDIDEQHITEVAALPWESMVKWLDEDYGTITLATAPHMALVRRRGVVTDNGPAVLAPGEKLRIAVVTASPAKPGKFDYMEFYDALTSAATNRQAIEVLEIVTNANRKSIDEVLRKKPHIFHFIGHGRLTDEHHRDTGQVALMGDSGQADWVSSSDFSQLFNIHKPGLVVLQTCESAALSDSQVFAGIASAVVQMKIPAVVGMQFKISIAAAIRFAIPFYNELLDGKPVDQAMQEARLKVSQASSYQKKRDRDFVAPVLYLSTEEGRLFQRQTDDREEKLIKELKAKLSDRFDEIGEKLYPKLSNFLKEKERQRNDKRWRKKIELLQRYFDSKISYETFKDKWLRGVDEEAAREIPDYPVLADLLRHGELIPFLGPGILPLSGYLESRDVVKKIAEDVDCCDFVGSLAMLSQYCNYKKGHNRRQIIKKIKDSMNNTREGGKVNPFYDLLVEIDKPMLVISTSYDDLLEQSFLEKGKKFAVVYHRFLPGKETHFAKLQVCCPGNPGIDGAYTAEGISDLKLLDGGHSIIYKIGGCFHLQVAAIGHEPIIAGSGNGTHLLLEEDFFHLSKYLESSIPDHFLKNFKDCGFLFLGYGLEEWQHRLIAYVLLNKWQNDRRSYTLDNDSDPYRRSFWNSRFSLRLLGVELKDFVENLYRTMRN